MHSCYQTVVRSVSILLINLFGGFSSEADNVSAVAMLDDQARLAKELLKLACMQPPQQIEGMKSTFWDSHVQQPQWVNLIELLRVMLEADLSLTCFGLLHVIRQLVSSQRLQAQAAADAGLLGVAAQIARKEGRPALVANKVITAVRSFGLGDEEQMFANVARYQEQLDYLNNLVSCLSDSPSIISDLQALENAITLLTNGVTERHTSVEDFLRTSKFLSTFEHILLRRCGTGGLVSETSNFTTAQLIINILLVLVSELSADTRTQNWRGVVVGVECVLSRLDTVTSDEDVGSSTHELIIDIARFFNVLCTFEPDIAVLCASLSVKTYLYDKLGSNMRNETCRNLLDSIEKASCHVTCAQKVTKLYWSNVHRVLQKVYMCCMQSSSVPPIPFFDYLCLSVSGVDGATISGEVDGNDLVLEASTQCFPHVVENLTTDESTYWQSQGSAGTHWVSISTKSGKKRIKAVTLHAWSQGDSYVPERLAVYGGETTRMCTHELVSVQRASYHPQKGCKIDFQWSQYPCIRICVLGNVSSGCDCQLKQIAVETSSISDHLTILDPNLTFRMTARTLFHLRQAEALLTDQKCSVVQALHSFVSAIDRLLAAEQSALRSLEVVCKRSCWALLLGLFASVENYLKKETGATFFRRVFSLYFQPNDLLDEDKAAFAGSLDRFLILLSANSTSTSTVASTMKGVLYTAIDPVVQAVFAAAEARPADLPTGLMDLLGHVDHLARVNFHPDFARLKKAFFDGFLRLSDVASITAAHTLMNTLHEAVTTQDFAEAIIHSVTTVILLSEGTLFGSTCFGLHKALMAHRLASRGLLSLSKSELYLDVLLNRGDGCAAEIHTASTDVQDVHNHFSSVFQRRSSPDFDVLLLAHAYQLPVTPLPLPAIFRERVTECLESYSPHAAACKLHLPIPIQISLLGNRKEGSNGQGSAVLPSMWWART
ncbi:MAG: uncharacterized protein KVP18_004919 [Porospora cf. gigantea A]|uniref:uncharacterized protein n=1 Tax=Porospora cf. gigantea A TaxID=2853593 RepID=UPI003559BBD2|nr:MAG: hypothetical protein KVP18_004919 [Porospora cf. gigantea A]